MSKPVNPYTIGAFLVGSLALLIIAILVFGGGTFLKKKIEYVIYFDSVHPSSYKAYKLVPLKKFLWR